MGVMDKAVYERQRQRRSLVSDLWLPMMLFGSMGAITWAIRGTGGWGGVDGAIVPGMTWGVLWYYLFHRKGIDARVIPLWLGLGVAIGGELGYGQYVSWIRGTFSAGTSVYPVAPWIGYAWFAICGMAWAGPGGIALGWALDGPASWRRWFVRLAVPLAVGCAAWLLVQACPALFFPNHRLGLYSGELDHHLTRTVETNTKNFVVAAWWAGAVIAAALTRERATLAMGGLIGIGFGVGFPLAAVWCLGYTYAPRYIDWWKMWEMNAGANLGMVYAVALYWALRWVDLAHRPNGDPVGEEPGPMVRHRRRNVALVIGVSLLLLILAFGATYRTEVLLGFYNEHELDQYAWPLSRIVTFAPAALLILGVMVYKIARIVRSPHDSPGFPIPYLPERMTDLIAGIGAVGAVTIWPSQIAALYALSICAALFALNRFNHRIDHGVP